MAKWWLNDGWNWWLKLMVSYGQWWLYNHYWPNQQFSCDHSSNWLSVFLWLGSPANRRIAWIQPNPSNHHNHLQPRLHRRGITGRRLQQARSVQAALADTSDLQGLSDEFLGTVPWRQGWRALEVGAGGGAGGGWVKVQLRLGSGWAEIHPSMI